MTTENTISRTEKARTYDRIHNWLFLVDLCIVIILLTGLMWGGASSYSAQLKRWINDSITTNNWGCIALYVSILSIGYTLITLPYSWWKGYYLEHYFDLSNQSLFSWFTDQVKSLAISTVIGVLVFEIFYALIRTTGNNWWIWAACVWILLQVVLGMIFPIFILPLFYHTEKCEQPDLVERINTYARDAGVQVLGIFRLDLSEKTKKANAMLAGMGKTKRILLGDTLLNEFTEDEIVSVLAHEFGHFYHKHLIKLIAIAAISAFIGMWIAHELLFSLSAYLDIPPDSIATAPLLILALFAFSLVTMPLTNIISRYFERQSDSYALNVTRNPAAFISAMERLADQNLANKEPHPVIEFILHSHPSIGRRIAAAKAWDSNTTSPLS